MINSNEYNYFRDFLIGSVLSSVGINAAASLAEIGTSYSFQAPLLATTLATATFIPTNLKGKFSKAALMAGITATSITVHGGDLIERPLLEENNAGFCKNEYCLI